MSHNSNEVQSMRTALNAEVGAIRIGQIVHAKPDLKIIIESVIESAANKALNAAYGGARNDGGASEQIRELAMFLKGAVYGSLDAMTHMPYYDIITKEKLSSDPRYQEYLKLKNEFEKFDKT